MITLNTSGVVRTLEHLLLSGCIVLLYAKLSLLKYRYLHDSEEIVTCLAHCSATELTSVVNCGPRKLSRLLKKSINKLVLPVKQALQFYVF